MTLSNSLIAYYRLDFFLEPLGPTFFIARSVTILTIASISTKLSEFCRLRSSIGSLPLVQNRQIWRADFFVPNYFLIAIILNKH
jgi:hypothetical protein